MNIEKVKDKLKTDLIKYIHNQLDFNGDTILYRKSIYKNLNAITVQDISDGQFYDFCYFYLDFINRFIPKKRYNCHLSNEIQGKINNKDVSEKKQIHQIIYKLQNEKSLLREGANHYSKSKYRFSTGSTDKKNRLDLLLNAHSLNHIHTKKGSDEIIILRNKNNNIYLLDIFDHRFFKEWSINDLNKIIINNFSNNLSDFHIIKVSDYTPYSEDDNFVNEEEKQLTQIGFTTMFVMNGGVYCHSGQAMNNWNRYIMQRLDYFLRWTNWAVQQLDINNDWNFYFEEGFIRIKSKHGGYFNKQFTNIFCFNI